MGHVFIVNGWGGVGKSTFENCCWECGNDPVFLRSMADRPKRQALSSGWNGEKDDAGRELIASLKRSTEKYNPDFLIMKMVELVTGHDCHFCTTFIDTRETRDIEELKKRLNAKTILVTNNRVKCPDCESDKNIKLDGYDYVIENNGTLDDLKQKAKEFMEGING